MRKSIFLPCLAVAGGVGGYFLRRWQLASAYDPETGLFAHGAPASYALLGSTALLALIFLLLLREKREGIDDFLPAFGDPGTGQMTALAGAGFLMMLAGGLGMQAGFKALRLWRAAPDSYPASNAGAQLLAGGLCVLAGFGVLYMGRMAYRGELNDAACRLASFPAFAGLVWLFSTHLQNGTEPVLMKYGFRMAAVLLLTLAHYDIAVFLFGRPCPRRTVFLSLGGTVMGIVALADRPDLFTAAAILAFSLSALTFTRALLDGPWRMPPSGEDDDQGPEDTQTEH